MPAFPALQAGRELMSCLAAELLSYHRQGGGRQPQFQSCFIFSRQGSVSLSASFRRPGQCNFAAPLGGPRCKQNTSSALLVTGVLAAVLRRDGDSTCRGSVPSSALSSLEGSSYIRGFWSEFHPWGQDRSALEIPAASARADIQIFLADRLDFEGPPGWR